MRIGIFVEDMGKTVDEYLGTTRAASAAGIESVWLGERLGWDPLTLLAITGREVAGIGLGTAVMRSYARHPLALASQALTVGNGLKLGIGPSHRPLIEGQYGYSYDRPIRHLREYLSALIRLLRGESVSYQGETVKVEGQITAPGTAAPPVLISALGPQMLRLAGELADGTITVWAGARSIAEYFAPAVKQVYASICVSVTDDPAGLRDVLNQTYGPARDMPSYRAVLDREGFDNVGETAVVGDENAVRKQIQRFADAGTAELIAVPFGSDAEQRRTIALLGDIAG
ncbi:F420-dependent oxidoreductase-like protein [Kibdelosporangium banguiense]|uniref:F420-dependent oxidoreductase-like protein n=1 Tax=Kibdelosporangium banguiense TaxID=1365924 RepID=A0ABS4TN59_9PSEU|nr:TIGR03564 family F420-dependent LLM class oxidoreductase [Kibdelosporangium banguiense]MBP2325845.1 F420-dependent oxidoreductase-like protein [Kibdelosporangium banguiense]